MSLRLPGFLFVPTGDEVDLDAEALRLRKGLLMQFGIEVLDDIVFRPVPDQPGVYSCVYTIRLPPPRKNVLIDNLVD